MSVKRILTAQDLSCVGQCSLTVALPVLSAFGVETAVLPTAVLSNHTMFKGWSYLDLTPEIKNIFAHWRENEIKFDGFYLGYLGKKELMELCIECFNEFSVEGAPVIIDPVFADGGKLYAGFNGAYVKEMAKLISRADVILPNLTEACFMADIPYTENYDGAFIEKVISALKKLTKGKIVITGVGFNGNTGEAIFDGNDISYVETERLPVSFHGTGDVFASVFTANYIYGKSLSESALKASRFVIDCIKATDKDHVYGVSFEKVLSERK